MGRISRKIWDALVLIIGGAAAFGLFALLYSAFWLTVREIEREPIRREVVVDTADSGPEAAAETARYELYVEGEGAAPAWYRPDEPMSAEWHADGSGAGSKTGEPDGAAVAARDIGCPDYNLDPEVRPDWLLDVPLDRYLQEYIHRLCEESGLPYTLAIAVIEQESNYDPSAISPYGDWGLMQINSVCHEWLAAELGITDWLDPYQSARAGIYILGAYYARYGADSGTLIAYHRGQAAAEALFSRGIYATAYSDRVMSIRYRLETAGR